MPFSVTTRDVFVNCDISAGAQNACTFPRGMATTTRPSDLHGRTHHTLVSATVLLAFSGSNEFSRKGTRKIVTCHAVERLVRLSR